MWPKGEGEWNGMISRRNGEASTVVGAFGGWTLLGESEELRNFVFSCDTHWVFTICLPAASNLDFFFGSGDVVLLWLNCNRIPILCVVRV